MNIPVVKKLAIPLVLLIIYFFWSDLKDDDQAYIWALVLPVILLSIIYVFQYQINHWWWRRFPPVLEQPIINILKATSPYFNGLAFNHQQKFLERLAIFMYTKSFTLKREKDYEVEEDTKAIMAHEFIRLNLHREQYLMPHYDQFILYDHPFGTPAKPVLHCYESHYEDGVVILSREQLFNGISNPQLYFNSGLWSAIQCFISLHPQLAYPSTSEYTEDIMNRLLPYSIDHIKTITAEDHILFLPLLCYLFFEQPERLADYDLKAYDQLTVIFDPKRKRS